ncbi:MAG: hypothetical protein E7Y34_03035, partial [Mycoplasma sp.]|nr:hypothetical protein [Mycoplasma sp.]
MKNKKIILGLGTITALGAMSMAFVACGLKASDVDEKIKDFKEKELPHIINVEVFKTQVDKFFSEIGKGSKKEDPKEIQYDFKQTDTVKNLMDVIKELMVEIKRIKCLADEYDLYVPTD